MKKNICVLSMVLLLASTAFANSLSVADSLENELSALRLRQSKTELACKEQAAAINALEKENELLTSHLDSLNGVISQLENSVSSTKKDVTATNKAVNDKEQSIIQAIKDKTLRGGLVLGGIILLIVALCIIFIKRINKNNSAVQDVKAAQDKLSTAHAKIEEESIKLDSKLLSLLEQKVDTQAESTPSIDHSLVLKVADEVTRIELNLSRMDPGTRGYRQLTKAVERIKNNFKAKGYEITDLLGKKYDEGMRIKAEFEIDESLELGDRIIWSIAKPQVIYNGKIIQKATVTVKQNI